MTATRRILVASHRPALARALREFPAKRGIWELAGQIDPRNQTMFAAAAAAADVVLIEARDLIWLRKHRSRSVRAVLQHVIAVVVLSEHQILDVATSTGTGPPYRLLIRNGSSGPPARLLQLAIEGYIAVSETLLRRLLADRLRLDIARSFSAEERRVLACLGGGLSNRAIAEVTGISLSRVKTLVHLLIQKLRMNNRTAVGVFAVTHGLVQQGAAAAGRRKSDAIWR